MLDSEDETLRISRVHPATSSRNAFQLDVAYSSGVRSVAQLCGCLPEQSTPRSLQEAKCVVPVDVAGQTGAPIPTALPIFPAGGQRTKRFRWHLKRGRG